MKKARVRRGAVPTEVSRFSPTELRPRASWLAKGWSGCVGSFRALRSLTIGVLQWALTCRSEDPSTLPTACPKNRRPTVSLEQSAILAGGGSVSRRPSVPAPDTAERDRFAGPRNLTFPIRSKATRSVVLVGDRCKKPLTPRVIAIALCKWHL